MKETVNRFEEEIITTSNLSEMKDTLRPSQLRGD
mgnify:CR=1 FL=1